MRKPNPKMKRWMPPFAIELAYTRVLTSIADEVEEIVRAEIFPILADYYRQDAVEDQPESAGWFETLRQAFIRTSARLRAIPFETRVTEFGRRVSDFNKNQFHAMLRRAYSVDVFKAEPWLTPVLKVWESENIRLIKSIPADALDAMNGKIINAVKAGRPLDAVRKEVQAEFGVTRRRAELIANDQIGKLNGQLSQERQTGIGVKKYKWRGSLDERERVEHVEREGQVYSWDKPPWDGHPGQPIRCRCTPEAILPLLEDIEGLEFTDLTPARGRSLTVLGG